MTATLVDPACSFSLPRHFDYETYIDIERELWALFPETDGKRVNFAQVGLTAQVFGEVPDIGDELGSNETYFLMPCPDQMMRPIRMRMMRRLTTSEYRMAQLTALKLVGKLNEAVVVMAQVGEQILGAEVLEELHIRQSGTCLE
jgi:hypothetical protein